MLEYNNTYIIKGVKMTNKEQKKLFPWNFIVSGILICCLLTCARMAVHDVDNPVVTWFVVMVISVLLGYIPIKIAYRKPCS